MTDHCPDRPPADIDPGIWYRSPAVAAAMLGYADGRCKAPRKPPCVHQAEYHSEYDLGRAIALRQQTPTPAPT